ncbi:MAG: glycosyltransferase family 4 protein [Candidatus Niyogibacteria bacterium]|nr:MAG: glycosyltransferase family 4 protein [Candidatus Niyogibacteria bacterium]
MPEKSKILIFSTAYLPFIGGAELAIKEITDRLGGEFDFILFTARFSRALPAREKIGAVEVHRLGFGLSFDKYLLPILGYLKAKKIINRYKLKAKSYNLLLWGMMASFGGIAAYFLKRKNPDIKFLLTLQEGDPEEYLTSGRLGLMGFWLKKLVMLADQIQTISRYLKNLAVKAGASAEKTLIVSNGVDLEVFGREFSAEELKELRLKCGIVRTKDKIAITASRLVRKNAVDILIKAMVEIPGEYLLIAGRGDLEKELKKLTSDLKIEKRVRFLGNVGHRDLAKYYAISHLFVRPSRSEGLGSAFLEAMAAGLPIIGTNVGGIPDFLRDGSNGLFCEIDDPKDLAFKIKRIFYDQEFRKKLSENALRDARENYSWDAVATKMGGIFYRLIHTK